MTLADLLTKIDDEQHLALCNEERQLKITGDAASICEMVAKKILQSEVATLEVKGNVLWIWVDPIEGGGGDE